MLLEDEELARDLECGEKQLLLADVTLILTWHRQLYKSSAVAGMDDRLATIDLGRNRHGPKVAKQLDGLRCHLVSSLEVSVDLGDFVLDGTQLPPKKGTAPNFRPMSVVAKRLDELRCHLVWR